MQEITEKHIGRRAIYTDRNGNERPGVILGLAGPPSAPFVDLKLDNSKREHFFAPEDACVLVPEELLSRGNDDNS